MNPAFLILTFLLPLFAFAVPVPETGVTVTFPRASQELSAMNRSSLRQMVESLNEGDRIEVVGLPSQGGRKAESQARQRADKVSRFLMSEGIHSERIRVRTLSAPAKAWLKSDRREALNAPSVEVQVIRSVDSLGESF